MVRNGTHQRGFTLVELMLVISILGLIAAIAVPSFNGYLRANQVDTTADRITSDLALARSLSVSQGRVVRFVGTAAGYQIIDPITFQVIRDRTFEGTVALAADVSVNFFPWGAAEATTMNIGNGSENRAVVVLPTGIAEVH
ncbi:MAG: GspH/FimT family pseudopilin [Candidatus Krumholzibacteriia bacterium]